MRFIDSEEGLEAAAAAMAGTRTACIDTEFESRKTGTSLCLVQIAAKGHIFLIDALRLTSMACLGDVLGHADCEWVLHAGQQDLPLLLDAFALDGAPPIFDTQVAWALLTPEPSVSLNYVQYRVAGVRLMKTHQTDDWRRRPLPPKQLAYAASDVEYLPAIYEKLITDATELDRVELIHEATRETLAGRIADPSLVRLDAFRNAWQLDERAQAVLQRLILWYNEDLDDEGRAYAPAPKLFLALASRQPRTAEDLSRIKGLPQRWCQTYGERLVRMLRDAARDAKSDDFVPIDPPPYATYESIRTEAWLGLARASICEALRVSPEFVLPSRIAARMCDAILDTGEPDAAADVLTTWRATLLRDAYLQYCKDNASTLKAAAT